MEEQTNPAAQRLFSQVRSVSLRNFWYKELNFMLTIYFLIPEKDSILNVTTVPARASAPSRLYLERQKNNFHLHSVACTGTEVHLAACPLEFNKPNATSSCAGGMPAVISCMPGPLFMQNSGLKKKLKISVKYFFVKWSQICAGIVE